MFGDKGILLMCRRRWNRVGVVLEVLESDMDMTVSYNLSLRFTKWNIGEDEKHEEERTSSKESN